MSRGLYYRDGWDQANGPVLCVEGSSDTATLIAMGLAAVGRPSNTGGVELLANLLSAVRVDRPIVVLGENDAKGDGSWPGSDGAIATAQGLAHRLGRPIAYSFPPSGAKDVRDWFQAQTADLGDDGELEDLGKHLLAAILGKASDAVVWDSIIEFDDPELPRFPTEVLPGWLSTFVASLSEATQTPADLAGMLALSVVAVTCARKMVVQVRPGYREPLNIFVVVSQPPASRKSTVFAAVVEVVNVFERELVKNSLPAIAAAKNQRVIEEDQLKKLQKQASGSTGPEGEAFLREAEAMAGKLATTAIPTNPRMIGDDTTAEILASRLGENGGRFAILSPEGGIFGNMGGRYGKGSRPANFEVYLKAHAGDTLRVDRVGRPSEYVDRPALTLGLAVQPDVILNLAADPSFRGRGLLGRFLYAIPRSRVGFRLSDPPPVPDTVKEEYTRNISSLLEMPFGVGEQDEAVEHVVTLSEGAYRKWLEFTGWLEPQLADFGPLAHLGDWAGKLAGAVVRLAGLLHAADHAEDPSPWARPIPPETMERAITMARYLIPHARAAFAEMGADPGVSAGKYVLSWIKKRDGGSFTKKECFEATKGRFKQVDALEPALAILERHGYIRERVASNLGRKRGRPPSPIFDVNPATLGAEKPGNMPFTAAVEAAQRPECGPMDPAPKDQVKTPAASRSREAKMPSATDRDPTRKLAKTVGEASESRSIAGDDGGDYEEIIL